MSKRKDGRRSHAISERVRNRVLVDLVPATTVEESLTSGDATLTSRSGRQGTVGDLMAAVRRASTDCEAFEKAVRDGVRTMNLRVVPPDR